MTQWFVVAGRKRALGAVWGAGAEENRRDSGEGIHDTGRPAVRACQYKGLDVVVFKGGKLFFRRIRKWGGKE
jgi:hypothetical protein